jgi:hypothetical protein
MPENMNSDDALNQVLEFYPTFHKLIERIENDDAFKVQLQETTRQLITYTKKTSVALDFFGSQNILLMKNEKGWELKLPDPFLNDDCRMYVLRDAAAKLKQGIPLTPSERFGSLVALNALRAINALAMIADIPDRLEAPEGVADIDPLVWRKELAQNYQAAA